MDFLQSTKLNIISEQKLKYIIFKKILEVCYEPCTLWSILQKNLSFTVLTYFQQSSQSLEPFIN